jgi:3-phytase
MAASIVLVLTMACGAQAVKEVPACTESAPIYPKGDADDAAIWFNSASPAESLVISTDKLAGLHVYDLRGGEVQFVPLGTTNNVDLRLDFPFADGPAPIIAVTNMMDRTLTLLRFDERAKRIDPDPILKLPAFLKGPGACLYRDKEGLTYVAATGDGGKLRQWRLDLSKEGEIRATLIRSMKFSSSAEACVFDDELQRLYVAQEAMGIWRLPADPRQGSEPILADRVSEEFPPDVEGLAIFRSTENTGYLVASDQGNSTFRVYEREGENSYVGSFRIVGCGNEKAGGATHTDGIEIANKALGPAWPNGILIAHDGGNRVASDTLPNLKFVRWDAIAKALGLPQEASVGIN